ncbi:GGDEF domain-containing protein [Sporosarcina sp. CAU 1771]
MESVNLISLQQEVSKLRVEGKYKDTIEACFQLLEKGRSSNDYKSIFTALINKAASYYCIGEIEEAFFNIDEYLDYCSEHGDSADQLNGFNILFLLHEHNKDYVKAKATLQQAIELGLSIGKYNIVSNAYSNYSSILATEEYFEKALEYAEKGLEMAKLHKPKTPILELRVKLNIANAYIGMDEIDLSASLVEDLRNDPILNSFIREKTQVYDLYSRYLIKVNRYMEAYDSLTTAKELAESFNDRNLLKGILEKRCKVCELMGNVQLGFEAQRDYIAILDDLRQQEITMTAMRLEIKHDIAAIERRANRDHLTGLYNRSYMELATNEMLKKASTTGERISCIALDLDNLKILNDTYGHMFGDHVIKEIANTCKRNIRNDDLMGRFGGDEFAIIFKGISMEQTKMKAEQLVEAIRKLEIEIDAISLSVSVSLGVADNCNGEIISFNDLFHEADMALYQAKRNGKNRVYVMS